MRSGEEIYILKSETIQECVLRKYTCFQKYMGAAPEELAGFGFSSTQVHPWPILRACIWEFLKGHLFS